MKRLGPAVACALLLHAGLFWIGAGWFAGRTVPPVLLRFVTVTMSYRQEPEKAAVTTREEVPLPEKSAPVLPRQRPLPEKTTKAPVAQPAAQQSVVTSQQESAADAAAEKGSTETQSSAAPPADSQGDAVVREAIPLYKLNPPPRYPRAARRRGQQGTVVLSVHVDAQGRVGNLWLFESSGFRLLDNAALKAVKDWVFEPGMRGGNKVAMWVNVPVRFELE